MTKELNLETIHKDLKRFIIESGQTQKQFAEKMGIPPAHLAVLISGKHSIRLPTLIKILNILNKKLIITDGTPD